MKRNLHLRFTLHASRYTISSVITTVTLNPALDLTLAVDDFVTDDSNRVIAARKDPGGKGFNVSRMVKRLGYPTTAVGFLGGASGQEIIRHLKAEHIYVWHVDIAHETRVNVTISKRSTGLQTRFNQSGPLIRTEEWQALCALLCQLADNALYLVLSGSLPQGLPDDTYACIIRMLRKINPALRVVVDADGPVLAAAARERPFLIKPNLHEFNRYMGTRLEANAADRDFMPVLRRLQKKGPEAILLSLGKRGCLLLYQGCLYRGTGPAAVRVRSTVGAGDSLLAGFLTGLARRKSVEYSLKLALACATAAVVGQGTQLGRWPNVQKYLNKSKVQKLKLG